MSATEKVRVLRRIRDESSKSRHRGAQYVVCLLDDFFVAISGRTTMYHQCIVTELLDSLCEETFCTCNMGPLIRQLTEAVHFLHTLGMVHGGKHAFDQQYRAPTM